MKLNMKKLLPLLLVSLFPLIANASNWIMISKNNSGDSYFVDKQSFVFSGNEVTYWVKVNNSARNKFGDLSSKEQWTVNCRTRESNLLYMVTYSDFDNQGKNTGSIKSPIDWRPILPDSVGEEVFKFVCRR